MRKQSVIKKKKLKKGYSRRVARRMVAIMAEVAREDVRERLRESTSVTVATDESDGRKIFRVRCDTPGPPYRFDGVLGVHTKLFGEFKSVVDEVREDHAKRTHLYLESFHRRFFTQDAGVPQISPSKERRPTQASATSNRVEMPAINTGRQPVATENQVPLAVAPSRGTKRKRQPVATFLDEEGYNSYRDKVRVLASDGGSAERRRALFFSAAGDLFPKCCTYNQRHGALQPHCDWEAHADGGGIC
jgi:hypothetical protein